MTTERDTERTLPLARDIMAASGSERPTLEAILDMRATDAKVVLTAAGLRALCRGNVPMCESHRPLPIGPDESGRVEI
jgi:hypothetical protein